MGVPYSALRVGKLDDLAEIHHGHPIRDVAHHRQVMGDDHIRQVEFFLQVLQQIEDLRLNRDVQGRDRLVGNDEPGAQRKSSGNADPLPLTPGELVRIAVVVLWVEARPRRAVPVPLS